MNSGKNETVQAATALIEASEKSEIQPEKNKEEEAKFPEVIVIRVESSFDMGFFKPGDVVQGFYDKDYKPQESDYVIAQDISCAVYIGVIEEIDDSLHDYVTYKIGFIHDCIKKPVYLNENEGRLRFYRPMFTILDSEGERFERDAESRRM